MALGVLERDLLCHEFQLEFKADSRGLIFEFRSGVFFQFQKGMVSSGLYSSLCCVFGNSSSLGESRFSPVPLWECGKHRYFPKTVFANRVHKGSAWTQRDKESRAPTVFLQLFCDFLLPI